MWQMPNTHLPTEGGSQTSVSADTKSVYDHTFAVNKANESSGDIVKKIPSQVDSVIAKYTIIQPGPDAVDIEVDYLDNQSIPNPFDREEDNDFALKLLRDAGIAKPTSKLRYF